MLVNKVLIERHELSAHFIMHADFNFSETIYLPVIEFLNLDMI